MTNRWLTLLEAHVEKALLGLAGLFMLGMLYMYLVRSPNVVEYQREKLGPRKLLEAIKQDADELDRKVRSATAEESNPEDFSRQLEKLHAEGIFAKTAEGEPVLRPELRLAATFGQPIVVPGLKDSEEAVGSIALVTPLKPSQPRARTGRSLVLREQIQIAGLEAPPSTATPEEESPEPEEAAWVTVAAYFNKKAQYNEMIKSGYAPYRAKAYVVGADVQRQEMLSNGEFSDWQAVRATKAMPKFDVREPVFDDATGELMNKDDIRQGFDTVKASQATLMQPPFYVVEGGDFWEVPPLVGYEDDEELEEEEGREEEEQRFAGGGRTTRVAPPRVAGPPAGRMPGGGGPGVAPPRGGGGRIGGPRGGGGGGATPRAGGYPGAGVRSDAAERREARKQIRLDLKDARKLLGEKAYQEARGLADRIIGNQYASKGDVRKAKEIVKTADRWLKLEAERAEAARSGRVIGGRLRPSRSTEAADLITHPETAEPAVWFHDDTVEAGKTYRYRMRVKLWNRYVGRKRPLKDPGQAGQPVVVGEWSFPSEPVTVTPSTHFFFSGAHAPDSASADVWKWRKGRWFKERFDVSVGDVIGGLVRNVKTGEYDKEGDEVKDDMDFTTGAVVLDLRFDEPVQDRWRGKDGVFSYRDKISPVMVYLDPADGQVKERVLAFDRRDPTKKRLEDEAW